MTPIIGCSNIVENAQLTVAVKALQGRALRWWLWRSHRQSPTTWDAFTTVFLWRFKPEWREILPIDNEEEEPDVDLSLLSLSNSSTSCVAELTTTEDDVVVDAPFPSFNRIGILSEEKKISVYESLKPMDVVAYPISATIDNEKDQDLSPITTLCSLPPKPPDLRLKLVHSPLAPPPAPKPPDQILPNYSHQLMTHDNSVTRESTLMEVAIKFSTLAEKRAEANSLQRTRCPFAIDVSTSHIFPYDPGPLNSPPPLKVIISCNSQESSLTNLCGNQSHIILNSKNSFGVVGFCCCETSESSKHSNTGFSAVARHVFVKIPQTIMPTFYLNTTLLQYLETNFNLFQSSSFMLDCFTMSGISSHCGTLDIVHCGIVELRIAWSLLFGDYTHDVVLVTDALFQDHEFSIYAATTNKIFKYLKDFYNLEDKVGLHGVDSDQSCCLGPMFISMHVS